MKRSPLDHLVTELDKAFGIGWLTRLKLAARYYEAQDHVVVTATGVKRKQDGSSEKRKRIVAIVLKLNKAKYEKWKHNLDRSMICPIILPPLT